MEEKKKVGRPATKEGGSRYSIHVSQEGGQAIELLMKKFKKNRSDLIDFLAVSALKSLRAKQKKHGSQNT